MAREGDILDGRYRLVRLLGDGGMGNVFLAESVKLGNKPVAVKTLKPEYLTNKDLVARFLDEAHAASKVEHDNIVEVFDADIDAATGTPYIVQRYLKGTNLRAYLDGCPGGRLSPGEALEVLVPVMGALVATHKQRIIHRDIKPENIFLVKTSSGNTVPKLIDFGIAKHLEAPTARHRSQTRSGSIWGTFDYMSPEQARGEAHCDVRADIWSMGAVLFESLTGRLPYEVEGHHALLQRMLEGDPPRADEVLATVPAELADAVERALRVDRDARWPTMAAFISALINCPCYQGTVQWRAIPLSSPDLGEIPDLSSLARPATEEFSAPLLPDETAPIRLARTRARAIAPAAPSARTLQLVLPEPWSPRRALPAVAGVAVLLVGVLVGLLLRPAPPPAAPLTALASPVLARPPAPPPAPVAAAPVAPVEPPPAPVAEPVVEPAPTPPPRIARIERPMPRVVAPRTVTVPRTTPPRPRATSPARAPIQTEF